MLIIAKFLQVVLGITALITALNSLAAQSTVEAVGALSIAITLVLVVYILQKYIAKNSTAIELKNYRLRIYQSLLGIWAALQFIGLMYEGTLKTKIVNAVILGLCAFAIIAIEKRIAKNKKDTI